MHYAYSYAVKPVIYLSILFAVGLLSPVAAAEGPPTDGITYVIPVKDMIERALVHVVRRGVEQAESDGAGAIILDMDTPGGRLDATEEIISIITGARATTYTLVNPNAISAGAITAFATDHIYMTPGGRIGDAMPIMMSPLPFGAPQELPDGIKEKMVSPTVALIRSAAQRKGHDEMLAEAMVRPDIEYKIGDKMICEAGRLLTLTSKDAAQLVGEGEDKRPLLSEGTVEDLDGLLKAVGRENDRVVIIGVTATERIARVIEGFPMSGILLGLGLLLLYIEFKTPGFGVPGVAGISLLAVWFWGHHVAGLANVTEMLIFTIGFALLLVEILLIPGFGFVGVTGIALMTTAIIMTMVQHYPSSPGFAPPEIDVYRAIFNFSLALLLTFFMGAALARFLPKTSVFNRIALAEVQTHEDGYNVSSTGEGVVGLTGIAATPLRPAGIGEFESGRLNVVARGAFIDSGTSIVVAEVHGNRIVVEKAANRTGESENTPA